MTAPGATAAMLLLLALLVPTAAAHEDAVAGAGTHRLPSGASILLPIEVHYHRIVGHVRASDADATLTVWLDAPEGPRRLAGPGADLKINDLVACCKGSFTVPRAIRVTNEGPSEAQVTLRLSTLHDGIAVTNDDAETGALLSTVAAPGLAALAFGATLPRRLTATLEEARRWRTRAHLAFAALWTLSGVLAAWGMIRYGGGPVAGTLAATADLPATGNVILNTHAVLLLILIVLWIASVGLWTGAARRHPPQDRTLLFLGGALGLSALVACASWALEYGALVAPLLTMAAAASLPLGGLLWMHRARTRTRPVA